MAERQFTDKYDDIISLSRPVSKKRQPMPRQDRAAQFAPFAALTGHGESVTEAARITGQRVELDEYELEQLRGRLQHLAVCTDFWNNAGLPVEERPEAVFTYFQPDLRKEGGQYVTACGRVKKLDQILRRIVMLTDDGQWIEIPMDELIGADSEIFEEEI